MNEAWAWVEGVCSDPMLVGIIALIVLAAVLMLFLLRASERDRALSSRMDEIEEGLSEMFGEAATKSGAQADKSREEISQNLRGMGDSVSRMMGELSRAQQAQLDAFTGQLTRLQGEGERRDELLRQAVETRLLSYETRIDRIGDVLDDKLGQNERRFETMRQTVDKQMDAMRTENGAKLDEMRRAVDDKLDATLDRRLGESFRQVSERLDQVYRGLGEMQALASGVGDLKRVLTDVRARGTLGEIQLGALLSQVLSDGQYVKNVPLREGGERVDFAVRLPAEGGEALLPIDARFPQDVYQRLLDATTGGDQRKADELEGELEAELVKNAARVREQYVCPPETTAFAVMFLSTEGLYAEALRRPGLPERLQRDYGVSLAGPATLTALLNSIQMGFRSLALEKRSGEVWALLDAVRGEFADFAEALARTQKRIRQASESIDDAARRSRAVEKRLKGVKPLDAAERKALASQFDADWD